MKVYNPIRADMTEMRRGAVRPFGATEPQLRSEILGADATDECATRALTRYYIHIRPAPRHAPSGEIRRGAPRRPPSTVVPLIAEVWGGFAVDAMSFLRGLAIARGDTLDVERLSTTWAARSFLSYDGQRLSVAVTVGRAGRRDRDRRGTYARAPRATR